MLEKHDGDASSELILSEFGSSSGSFTADKSDQEEIMAELTRQMAENMLQEEDENIPISFLSKTNKPKPSPVAQCNQGKKYKHHEHRQQRKMNENGDKRKGGKFVSSSIQNGSDMKVVFLGETGLRNGSSSGTGVFIPHVTSNLPDHMPCKKPGRCSAVLIPERVLHTLKQHFERRNDDQSRPNQTLQKSINNNYGHEELLQLPQEWTY